MKTKSLLIAAATLAAGVMSSQAGVYSQNVVGYVNITIAPTNYTLLTVPVDYDGTGTNNQVNLVIGTNLPSGANVQYWTGSGYSQNAYSKSKGWGTPTQKYNPGQGIFIYNPSNTTTTLTIVGTVLQGGLTNSYVLPNSYSLVGSQFPVQGGITTTYGYVPSSGDSVQIWNGNGFIQNSYSKSKGWGSGEPIIPVGGALFLKTTNLNPVWGTNFIVQ